MNDIYLMLNNEQAGPFTMGQLRGMWSNGAITSQTLYWQEGMTEWLPLGNLVEDSAPQKSAVVPPARPKQKVDTWSAGQFVILAILSLVIPLIGFLLGLLAMGNPLKRQQGLALIVLSLLSCFVSWSLFVHASGQ